MVVCVDKYLCSIHKGVRQHIDDDVVRTRENTISSDDSTDGELSNE